VIHPVPLLRSWTPVEPMCPCLGGHIGAAPTSKTVKASDDEHFGAHSRSFNTCSPTLRVSCCHSRARLAFGWLAGLYREGVEPSGSLRKVSAHMIIHLSCPPDATPIAAESWCRESRQPWARTAVAPTHLERRPAVPSPNTQIWLMNSTKNTHLSLRLDAGKNCRCYD
jgi:hypothetical protein